MFLGQHEAHVLLGHLELRDIFRAAFPEELDQPLHQLLGRAGSRCDADRLDAVEPLLADLLLVVDQVGLRAVLARDLDQAVRVGGVREPITSTRSQRGASCLTASWRFCVA